MTDTPTLDLEKLAELRESGLVLTTGHHDLSDGEFATGCAMDLIGWQVTGDSTDMPECVHPTLARHVHRINAEVKHGTNNTPRSKEMTDPERLVVLVEEVGEVARAITYDEGDKDALVGELLQVAAMAMAWVEGLES
jgi:hypothetical protein